MNTFDWPSERIPHGGIFHQNKINYSKDTHNMIKGNKMSLETINNKCVNL